MADRISRRRALVSGAGALAAVRLPPRLAGATAGAAVQPSDLPWPEARAIVAETTVPTFPDATFNVRDHGAKGNGSTDDWAAIMRTIDACAAAGGGTVLVPGGTYLTGAIYLKSDVNLRLEGSTLRFSSNANQFPTVLTRYEGIECMNHSPMIYAFGETNIAVTGHGTLDAAKTSSWNKGSERAFLETLVAKGVAPRDRIVPGSGHAMRCTFIEPYNCTNVLIQGVNLRNSMFWQIHPVL